VIAPSCYIEDGVSFDEAIKLGLEMHAKARMTEDCREGIEKFLKK